MSVILILAADLAIVSTGCARDVHMPNDGAIHTEEAIGTVDFQASCDDAVQNDFDHALGLLHHMMYVQAREAFKEITETDPNCAIAYWGIATSLFQPLWGTRPSQEELHRGWLKIEKAEALVDDEREYYLIKATKAFFQDPESEDFRGRIHRWIQGMEAAYHANPGDLDTAALYALSRLTLAQQVEERDPLHEEAEGILRAIYEKIPTHPGAIHYTIHATDAKGRAKNALDMVAAYGEIAPEVPHALHMPSHIYVRLGDWPKVINWNRRSADAALKDTVNGAVSHHYLHAMDYLLYAHLQQGEDDKARTVLNEAIAKDPHQASFVSAFHSAAMPARYVVERRQWNEATGLEPRTPKYLPWDESLWAEGLTWYARGLGSVYTDNQKTARQAEERLEALRDQAKEAGDKSFATYIEVDRRILAGWIAWHEDAFDNAVALMRSAAELEASVEKHPVTPGALLPPNEALGHLLMDLGRPAEALEAYRISEEMRPGRYHTLLGAARAAAAAGDQNAARTYYHRVLEITLDSQRPGVVEARQFLGRSCLGEDPPKPRGLLSREWL
ncbi:tetratricopeptide repeat protein [Nitrosococcus wardiae]|uniref:tetratricopeptide repeat protein n=1 Tax=Nitrosococcus wardiae TaxID=1814290 RepID=UPI001F0FDC35|nr:tetratricopeptide repeat protein [Nitrosococcus wardiae]